MTSVLRVHALPVFVNRTVNFHDQSGLGTIKIGDEKIYGYYPTYTGIANCRRISCLQPACSVQHSENAVRAVFLCGVMRGPLPGELP